MSEWIDVRDRLPETDKMVLVYFKIGEYENMFLDLLGKDDIGFSEAITHWMPLPAPPEGNDDD